MIIGLMSSNGRQLRIGILELMRQREFYRNGELIMRIPFSKLRVHGRTIIRLHGAPVSAIEVIEVGFGSDRRTFYDATSKRLEGLRRTYREKRSIWAAGESGGLVSFSREGWMLAAR